LFEKGRNDQPQPAYAAAGVNARGADAAVPAGQPAAAGGERPAFCGQCGEKNSAGSRFCAKCGAELN